MNFFTVSWPQRASIEQWGSNSNKLRSPFECPFISGLQLAIMSWLSSLLNPTAQCPSQLTPPQKSPQNCMPSVDICHQLDSLQHLLLIKPGPIPASVHTQQSLHAILGHLSPALSSVHTMPDGIRPGHNIHPVIPISPPTITPTPKPHVQTNVWITHCTMLTSFLSHLAGTFLQYPDTVDNGMIGHLFSLDVQMWDHPKDHLCYSLGEPKGATVDGHPVFCHILTDSKGTMVPCQVTHWTCESPPFELCIDSIYTLCVVLQVRAAKFALKHPMLS